MSKSLVEEYKVQMQADIPDLWARIEASLPEKELNIEKSHEVDNSQIANVVDFAEAKKNAEKTKEVAASKKKEKQKKSTKFRKVMYSLSGVAVAGIAMLIVLPFINDSRVSDATQYEAVAADDSGEKSSTSKKDKKSQNMDEIYADASAMAEESAMATDCDEAIYSGSRADAEGLYSTTDNALEEFDSDEVAEFLSSYEGVTCEFVSVDRVSGKYLYEVEVTACESDDKLAGNIIYIESDEKILKSGEEITADLYLIEVQDGEKCIYSVVD